VILLDTSVLIAALTGAGPLEPVLTAVIARGERLAVCTPVLYEWRRGPRTEVELDAQEGLVPSEHAWAFGPQEALLAAALHRGVRRAREREVDLAIAACALIRGAHLWTRNPADFADIPGLALFDPA
jgi:predicted nucleic acid-binding protein